MLQFTARERLKLMAGAASSVLLTACGGGGSGGGQTPDPEPTFSPAFDDLKTNFRNNFRIGAALKSNSLTNDASAIQLLQTHFNSITPEFEMKMSAIAPTEGVFNFDAADALVDYAEDNGMQIEGHALLWHQDTPDYFFNGTVADIRTRLENYITTVVTRYRGRIGTWHVVNEVVANNLAETTLPYRNSNWYQAVGSAEFIDWAFNAARAADPDAVLLLNEFGTDGADKRTGLIQIMQDLVDRNIPVDGVGHQMHLGLETNVDDVFAAIDAVDNMFAGLINHITELDVSMYDDPASCYETQTGCAADLGTNLPTNLDQQQAQIYRDLFAGLILKSTLESVAMWGVYDGDSWLNSTPITRTNYPLLFDRDFQFKTAYRAIMDRNFEI